jgi:hypothetical protein
MADVDAQVLGRPAQSYDLSTSTDQQALINAMTSHMAVTIATVCPGNSDDSLPYGLYGCHAYAVTGYDSRTGDFTLYNPWGFDQPTAPLSWAQLQATCDDIAVAATSATAAPAMPGQAAAAAPAVLHTDRSTSDFDATRAAPGTGVSPAKLAELRATDNIFSSWKGASQRTSHVGVLHSRGLQAESLASAVDRRFVREPSFQPAWLV